MSTKRINGLIFEKMLKNGLAALAMEEEELNSLNVFPVADGDTGTNMRLTLENGLKVAKSHEELGAYLRGLSEGMLMGARGNSGVILSQIFRGFYICLSRTPIAGPGELRNALIQGYRTAYQAVNHPVEGTILTVAREGIEHIRPQISRNSTADQIFSMYLAEMKKSLAYTPELLPELKEAGVIDSGAKGYIVLVEGMLKYLFGEKLKYEGPIVTSPTYAANNVDMEAFKLFNENSLFIDGYCMEFILQLLKQGNYSQSFKIEEFIEDLNAFGTSIVAVQTDSRVKVHVHTLRPDKIIRSAREYGEFLTFKLENMQLQHNEHIEKKAKAAPRKKISVIAVADNPKTAEILRSFGCDEVIDAKDAMNVSVGDLTEAFERHIADTIIVFPNNKNVIQTACQAGEMFKEADVRVMSSKSIPEGYFALAMDVQDSEDAEYRIRQMNMGMRDVVTVATTTATKEYSSEKVSCEAGDMITVVNGDVKAVSTDSIQVFLDGLSEVPDIEDMENCMILRGVNEVVFREEKLKKMIEERFPYLEVNFMESESKVYNWLAGVL